VSVGLDDNHSIVVWDWRKGEKLATTRYIFFTQLLPFIKKINKGKESFLKAY
jgi:hypothetical protein